MKATGDGLADPTPRQRQVLQVIVGHLAREGTPPTWREIGAAVTPPMRSIQAVTEKVRALVGKGWLEPPDTPRPAGGSAGHGSGYRCRALRLTAAARARLREVRAEGGRVLLRRAQAWEELSAEEARALAGEVLRAAAEAAGQAG